MREGRAQRRVPRRLTGSVTAGPWRAHCSSCRRSVAARRGRTDRPPAECKPCRLQTECYKSARDFAPRSNHALGILKDKVSVVERRSNPRSARTRIFRGNFHVDGGLLTRDICFFRGKEFVRKPHCRNGRPSSSVRGFYCSRALLLFLLWDGVEVVPQRQLVRPVERVVQVDCKHTRMYQKTWTMLAVEYEGRSKTWENCHEMASNFVKEVSFFKQLTLCRPYATRC